MKLLSKYLLLVIIVGISACKKPAPKPTRADKIVQKALKKAGGSNYNKAMISFKFRGVLYKSNRDCGSYTFYRVKLDSSGNKIQDVLSNNGFKRTINGKAIELSDSTAQGFINSVNSVHYFMQLPFGLNDAAVHKKYVGEEEIGEETYDKIAVSFAEENGGEDHNDNYMYWISQKNKTIDYLAYSYETSGGGMRFREAYNPRKIRGIRFVDYKNYAPKDFKSVKLENLGKLFEAGKLEMLSKIVNKNIQVSIANRDCK